MMQAKGNLCIGWLHGLGVPALHSKVPCTYSVCNPGLFAETRLSTLCRDDLAFDFRSSPDGSADDPEVGHRNIVNSTRVDGGGHFKAESVVLSDASGSGSHKTGCESQRTSSEADPIENSNAHENKPLPVASTGGPVSSESRGELLQCEAGVSNNLEDLLRHYWLLRDSEAEIQKMKSRQEPAAYDQTVNWSLKKSRNDSGCFESSSSEAGEEGDEKDEIRFERDDTDSLASLSTISEEDPEELSSADSSNRIDSLFGDPDRQDFRRFYQPSRPSFGVQNAAKISTTVDDIIENEPSSSLDYEDSVENLDDGEGKEDGKPTSDSEEDCAVPPPLSADDTFALVFSRHVTDTCPSFSPVFVSQEFDVKDDYKSGAPGTADDPEDTEVNPGTKHGEYTISDTRVHLNLIARQDDHQTAGGCLDELISNDFVAGKENSSVEVAAGRSSLVSSPTSWYTVSDVFNSQSFDIADSVAAEDIAMSAAYAKCTAIYRCVATDSSATDTPATCVSVSTKVTAADPVTALSRAASRVASLAAAKACPAISACTQGNLEILLTASCSLSPPRGDMDSISTDGVNDVNVVTDTDLPQAFDTVDNADLRQAFATVDGIPTDGVNDVNAVIGGDLPQAFDTVDNAEPRCYSIETVLSDDKPRFISMVDSATETTYSVADAAVQSEVVSFSNTEDFFTTSTEIWNSTSKDALTGEDDTIEDIVFAQNSAEAGNNFSCQMALPSAKTYEGSKSSGYGSRSSSDDLLEDPDDYEVTGVAVKDCSKFKTPMPQHTDTINEIEELGQELPTRDTEVSCSDQGKRRNTGNGQDTLILNDKSNENLIAGQDPLFENKPMNNNSSDKTVNGDDLNFVQRKNDAVIPTDRRNDARAVLDADLRQAFDTVDTAERRGCNIEADLSDQKIQTEGVGSPDNHKDNCCVGRVTEDEMCYKNREFIGFTGQTVASRDHYVRRSDTPRVMSRPVIRSKSLLLETDIDTLEHRRTVVAANCSTSSVAGEGVTGRSTNLLLSAESQNQRRSKNNKSRDHFSSSSDSNRSSFDLVSKEALEFMLSDDTPPPRYFSKRRSNQNSDSHKGGYYNSEPILKPTANKKNTFSKNSNEIIMGKDVLGAGKKPETRVERTLHRDSADRIGSQVSKDHHHHHHHHHQSDDETRNAIEHYESSPSLRRRSLSMLTTPSSGTRKKSDVTPETEGKPEIQKRSPWPEVSSSFENLLDSLLGITAVMSMETAARCGPNPPFASGKGQGKPSGRPPAAKNPVPPSSNKRRTFAKPSPSQNETNVDQGRPPSSSSLPSPLVVPLSVSPPDPTQTAPARSLPAVRKREHFRKARHIFLKCGFCAEGNRRTSTPAKEGKAPVVRRKNSNGADKNQH